MTIKQAITFVVFIAFGLTSCATYSIQKESLVDQLKQNQKLSFNIFFPRFSILNYPINRIDSIKCLDKKGNQVWLYPENTTFIFITKSTGKKVKADFNTVIFINDSIYGRRSLLFGKLRKMPVNDIEKIKIHVEKPKIKPVTNK